MPKKDYANNQKKRIKKHVKYKIKQTGIENKKKVKNK
jgi:hypothetical protein